MKSEFIFGKYIYKQIEKEEVIFYIMADYKIFVIEKDIKKKIKNTSELISEGMIYDSKEEIDKYGEFLDAMSHYIYGMNTKKYDDFIYFLVIGG